MPQILDESTFFQNYVAEALYDNIAESPDELPFKKGDVLIVLEQNTGGLQGWWLCSFKGRQGICPGNRLRLVAGVHNADQKSRGLCDTNSLRQKSSHLSGHAQFQSNRVTTSEKESNRYACKSDPDAGSEDADCRYDVPRFGEPIPVLTNGDYGNICGDVRQPQRKARNNTLPTYAIPKECNTSVSTSDEHQKYDIPRPINSIIPMSPTFSIGSSNNLTCERLFDSNRSGTVADYDVPAPISGLISTSQSRLPTLPLLNDEVASSFTCYDVPLRVGRELPLELCSAVKNLEQLQNEIADAINTFLSYSAPLWRESEINQLEPELMGMKLAILRLRSALHDLSEFGVGVLANASHAPDKGLVQKLRPLTKALFETNKVVQECVNRLEKCGWSSEVLGTKPASLANVDSEISCGSNSLGRLVICAQSLTEDVRRFSSFVQGNATLLFRKNRTVGEDLVSNKQDEANQGEHYSYINSESCTALNRPNCEAGSPLDNLRKPFDSSITEAAENSNLVQPNSSIQINEHDKQVLSFYATRCCAHLAHLTQAIDAFLSTVERNQPPKVFLTHGKLVVVGAYRLVYIGDTVHRNVSCVEINARVGRLSGALSEALATTVHEIKKAAVQFPSVVAVQDMVNSVVNVSYLARDLKICLVVASRGLAQK